MRKLRILLGVSILFLTVGCNDSFLDKYPLDGATDPTYWKNEQHLELAANACINYLRDKSRSVDMELLSDNVYRERSASYQIIGSGQFQSDLGTINSEWEYNYRGIRRANHFLENYDRAEVSDSIKNIYKGEARFIRAYCYAYLVNFFGDVPLITKTLDINDEELYGKRENKEVVVDWVINEFKTAASELRSAKELSSQAFGRPSKEAAWGFCSRFALYHERWNDAILAAEEVDKLSHHQLYTEGGTGTAYYQLFTYAGRASRNKNNRETILARVYSNNAAYGHNLSREIQVPNEETRFAPSRSLINSYLCNGLPIDNPASKYVDDGYEKEYTGRDPRMIQTILKRGDKWGGNPNNNTYYVHMFSPSGKYCRTTTGWYFKKYVEIPAVKTYNKDENDIILLRYAEVLLNWIEAKYMRGDQITQSDIDNSINKLRNRVAAPKMILADLAANNMNLLEEIRRERRVELALEGERYFDLLRWEQGEVLAQDVVGAKKTAVHGEQAANVAHYEVDNNGYIIVMSGRQFQAPKNYLWPVPFTQGQLNPNLLPNNPGW